MTQCGQLPAMAAKFLQMEVNQCPHRSVRLEQFAVTPTHIYLNL